MSKTYVRTLEVAVKILGGTDELASRLGVTSRQVGDWVRGDGEPPHDVFLKVVDVLLDDNGY